MWVWNNETRNLALNYLAVIMTLSVLFSAILYFSSTAHIGRPLPKYNQPEEQQSSQNFTQYRQKVEKDIEARDEQTKLSIAGSLLALNFAMLFLGAGVSYYLARKTLKPIEENIEKQSRFISDASHELRTPLTALLTNNEVAMRRKELSEDKAKKVISRNIQEIEKMRDLTNGLLELSNDKISEDKTDVNIESVVKEITANLSNEIKDKKIDVKTVFKETNVKTYKTAVHQILKIFTENAVKYSNENGKIEIIFDGKKVSVSDNGAGIDEKDLPYIFDRFYKSDKARTRTKNSSYGLGLAIAKNISEKYNLKISVSSKINEGSTFTVEV